MERTLLSNSNHCSPAVPPPPTPPHILRFLKGPDAQDGGGGETNMQTRLGATRTEKVPQVSELTATSRH